MKFTIAKANQALAVEDIEGLISAGAPADEYQDEAAQLVAALDKIDHSLVTEDLIFALLSVIWSQYFELPEEELALRIPALLRVSQAILQSA